ncbi:hypothetical protein [Bacteroides sp. Marseille-P3684]|nr:hypothetical protein [Bacteroides sp. Marseille-P3684]
MDHEQTQPAGFDASVWNAEKLTEHPHRVHGEKRLCNEFINQMTDYEQ